MSNSGSSFWEALGRYNDSKRRSISPDVTENDSLYNIDNAVSDTLKELRPLFKWIIIIFVLTFAIVLLIRIWHLVLPQLGWLCDDHIADIDSNLLTTLVGAFGGKLLGPVLNSNVMKSQPRPKTKK